MLVLEHDTARYGQILHERDTFLEHAITMYASCLCLSDQFDDDAPIRLCSLWLANFDEEKIQTSVSAAIRRIPSQKFIFLAVCFFRPVIQCFTDIGLSINFLQDYQPRTSVMLRKL